MKTKERIFHAVLFEGVALAIVIPLTAWITDQESRGLAAVGVGLSLFTVIWNYIYNSVFDRFCPVIRQHRSFALRVLHSVGFEGGLIFISLPTIAWFLQISFLEALMLEAGLLVFFLVYTMGFNWLYDRLQPYNWCFVQGDL